MRVYISIPITGKYYDVQKREADKAKNWLEENGMTGISPFENGMDTNQPRNRHMQRDIEMLLNADAIMPMQLWQSSKGCKLEMEIAKQTGKVILLVPWALEIKDNINYQLPF